MCRRRNSCRGQFTKASAFNSCNRKVAIHCVISHTTIHINNLFFKYHLFSPLPFGQKIVFYCIIFLRIFQLFLRPEPLISGFNAIALLHHSYVLLQKIKQQLNLKQIIDNCFSANMCYNIITPVITISRRNYYAAEFRNKNKRTTPS